MPTNEEILREIGSFDKYAQRALDQSVYPDAGTGSNVEIAYLGLGLAGEAGEAVDVIKKIIRMGVPVTRDDNARLAEYRVKLAFELGDTFWYIAQIMRVFGWTLPEIIDMNVIKLANRVENNEVAHRAKYALGREDEDGNIGMLAGPFDDPREVLSIDDDDSLQRLIKIYPDGRHEVVGLWDPVHDVWQNV